MPLDGTQYTNAAPSDYAETKADSKDESQDEPGGYGQVIEYIEGKHHSDFNFLVALSRIAFSRPFRPPFPRILHPCSGRKHPISLSDQTGDSSRQAGVAARSSLARIS